MMFLDPKKKAEASGPEPGNDCTINGNVHNHLNKKDLLYFLLISLPPFLLGGYGIYITNVWLLIPWVIMIIAFFSFIEIRVMSSPCHHDEETGTSSNLIKYGPPKPGKQRSVPMTGIERIFYFAGFTFVWGYPLPIIFAGEQLVLLLMYLAATIGFFIVITVFMCSQCMSFSCPLKSVDPKTRNQFFDKNPTVGEAWKKYKNRDNN